MHATCSGCASWSSRWTTRRPYFSNMRRRTSRSDSDLNGVVDVRYTGGARMLLLIEVGQGRWRFKVRVARWQGYPVISSSCHGSCLN